VGNERSAEWLTLFLKEPKKAIPTAVMPRVKGTDGEISHLVAYMLSLKK
jgi:hypothetical protein